MERGMTLEAPSAAFRARAEALLEPHRRLWPHAVRAFGGEHGWQHYVDEGARDASPILCVHGNPTWAFLWRHVLAARAPSGRVVAPDHLGCGLSQRSASFPARLADHAANLAALVEHLDLRDITLLVHDWGGAIGLAAARRAPWRYARLVLTNTGAFPSSDMPWRIALCRARAGIGPFLVERCNAFAGLLPWLGVADPRCLSSEARAAYLLPSRDRAGRRAVRKFVEDIPLDDPHPTMPELLAVERSLDDWRAKPVAIAWGEQDWCFTPRFRAAFERRLPHARVHLAGHAGHLLPEESPATVEAALDAVFDASHRRGAP
ncbi:MAG: Haloalkane dehalogenase [Planctomycetota bacterium]